MVMKLLAAVTIILAVPTVIFSLWGVNVPVPFTELGGEGFVFVISIALLATFVAGILLWKNDFL